MTLTTTLIIVVILATLAALLFGALTYALREYSRSRLEAALERRGRGNLLDPVIGVAGDLAFVTAVVRLFANALVLIGILRLLHETDMGLSAQYVVGVAIYGVWALLFSVALPHTLAKYAGEALIAWSAPLMLLARLMLFPVVKLMHGLERLVASASGAGDATAADKALRMEEEIESEILSVVEEGEKEGAIDQRERQMIESVIGFGDTTAGQIMTARTEIVALPETASLGETIDLIERSGHSRLPLYNHDLDHIIGILYARDLLMPLGKGQIDPDNFDLKQAMRPALYVPESKVLRDLLQDFRLQKVHIAIVLDEYGGTAGLITIEDVLEELVGDISDEHEPSEPAMIRQIGEHTWDADARTYLDELNRVIGLSLPEDAGYDTLGGFISTTLGQIPKPGSIFEHSSARFTIVDAEPHKVNRVRIELLPTHAAATEP